MRLSVAVYDIRISAALHASLMPLFTSAGHCCTNIEKPNKKLVYKTSFLWTRNTSFGSFSAPKFSPSVLGQWSQLASNSWQLRHFLGSKTLLTKMSIYKQWLQRSEGYYLHRLLTHTFEEQHVLPRFSSIKKVKRKKNIFYAASLSWDGWSPSSLHSPTLYSGIIKAKHLKRRFGAVRPVRKKVLLLKALLAQSSVCSVGPVDCIFLFPFPQLIVSFCRLHAGDGQCWAQPSAAW